MLLELLVRNAETVDHVTRRNDGAALVTADAFHPPRCVVRNLDPCLAHDVADPPGGPSDVLLDVELRHPEVTLATGGKADVAANPRDAKRLDLAAGVEIGADHVPDAEI